MPVNTNNKNPRLFSELETCHSIQGQDRDLCIGLSIISSQYHCKILLYYSMLFLQDIFGKEVTYTGYARDTIADLNIKLTQLRINSNMINVSVTLIFLLLKPLNNLVLQLCRKKINVLLKQYKYKQDCLNLKLLLIEREHFLTQTIRCHTKQLVVNYELWIMLLFDITICYVISECIQGRVVMYTDMVLRSTCEPN